MICFASLPYLASVACLGEPRRLAHSRSFQLAMPPPCTAPAELITCTADDRCAKPQLSRSSRLEQGLRWAVHRERRMGMARPDQHHPPSRGGLLRQLYHKHSNFQQVFPLCTSSREHERLAFSQTTLIRAVQHQR
jgi:hypothetical protein